MKSCSLFLLMTLCFATGNAQKKDVQNMCSLTAQYYFPAESNLTYVCAELTSHSKDTIWYVDYGNSEHPNIIIDPIGSVWTGCFIGPPVPRVKMLPPYGTLSEWLVLQHPGNFTGNFRVGFVMLLTSRDKKLRINRSFPYKLPYNRNKDVIWSNPLLYTKPVKS